VRSVLVLQRIERVDLREHLAVVVRGAVDRSRCETWAAAVAAARDEWTRDFGGEQFALGRAFYTHLETNRSADYFRDAAASDARVEAIVPGLPALMTSFVRELTDERVVQRRGWCGAGVHVFPAGEKVSRVGGVVHYDLEGLNRHHVAHRLPAMSLVLMLQPPGALRLWDVTYPEPEEAASHSEVIEYATGDLVAFDSYRLHQIQPFGGSIDRISATLHAAEVSRGIWETWF
jgi:hypothetical protein